MTCYSFFATRLRGGPALVGLSFVVLGLGGIRSAQGKPREGSLIDTCVGSLTSSVRQAPHARKTGEFLPCLESIAKIVSFIKNNLNDMVKLREKFPSFSGVSRCPNTPSHRLFVV